MKHLVMVLSGVLLSFIIAFSLHHVRQNETTVQQETAIPSVDNRLIEYGQLDSDEVVLRDDQAKKNINTVISVLNELYSDRIESYRDLHLVPLVEVTEDFGIQDVYGRTLILENASFRSLLLKWKENEKLKMEEQFIIQDYIESYFRYATATNVWCIEDACLTLVEGTISTDLCEVTKGNIFMGYSYCESENASRSTENGITRYSVAVFYNSIVDKINENL